MAPSDFQSLIGMIADLNKGVGALGGRMEALIASVLKLEKTCASRKPICDGRLDSVEKFQAVRQAKLIEEEAEDEAKPGQQMAWQGWAIIALMSLNAVEIYLFLRYVGVH